MFTGIVEEIGKIQNVKKNVKSSVLTIEGNKIFEDINIGDSISVNGVCLTVTTFSNNTFTADVMNETISRSSLGQLKNGSSVNLERAISANGRFGGHIVSGHIDGIGKIIKIEKDDNSIWYTIAVKDNLMKYTCTCTVCGIIDILKSITATFAIVSLIPSIAIESFSII